MKKEAFRDFLNFIYRLLAHILSNSIFKKAKRQKLSCDRCNHRHNCKYNMGGFNMKKQNCRAPSEACDDAE